MFCASNSRTSRSLSYAQSASHSHSVSRHIAILTDADTFVPFLASRSICIGLRAARRDIRPACFVAEYIRSMHADH